MNVAEETPRLTEAQFLRQVTELATLRGWLYVHFRPAMTTKGWRTPVSGPLGAGWPDLVLLRQRRLIFAELKAERGRLSEQQASVMEALGALMFEYPEVPEDFPIPRQRSYLDGVFHGLDKALVEAPKIEVCIWRPADWTLIEETLR